MASFWKRGFHFPGVGEEKNSKSMRRAVQWKMSKEIVFVIITRAHTLSNCVPDNHDLLYLGDDVCVPRG